MRFIFSRSRVLFWVLVGCLVSNATAWSKSPTNQQRITFEDHIKPIFRQHCSACHSQGNQKGGLALDTYAAVVEGGGGGEVVFDDGDFDGSRLWQLINHDDSPEMPPNQDKIPQDQLNLVRRWIEDGIPENSGAKRKPKKPNLLATIASTDDRPNRQGVMPEFHHWQPPVVTQRAAATSAIACSPWAPLVAIAGQQQIVLYHTDTGEMLGILEFSEGVAQGLRFSRGGDYLIAAGGQHSSLGVVAVYDVRSGNRVATVGDELDIVFDGDANESMTRIALGGPQRMLRIFDAANGTQLFELKKHTDWIYTVAYSPDGVLIASGDRSGGLCVWESDTGRLYLDLTDHKDAVHSVAWRDDSNVLASASADGTVKLWDMNQGKAIKSIGVGSIVYDVAFDHQGRLASSGSDKRVKLWDPTGKHIRDFQPRNESVLEVAFSHDGSELVYGDWDGQVVLADTKTAKTIGLLAANPKPLTDRVEEVRKQVALLQKQLVPIRKRCDDAQTRLGVVQNRLTQIIASHKALQAELDQNQTKKERVIRRIESIHQSLPKMVKESRDLHDALIAVRVTESQKKPDDLQSQSRLAEAELELANQLSELSSVRKQKLQMAKRLKSLTSIIDGLTGQRNKLEADRKVLEQQNQVAAEAADAAKADLEQARRRQDRVRQKSIRRTRNNRRWKPASGGASKHLVPRVTITVVRVIGSRTS